MPSRARTLAGSRTRAEIAGVDREGEEEEERGGEEVAQRSDDGRRARPCTEPDRARPTRNAPMAADTCTSCARPPTSSVSPKTARSSASSDAGASSRLRWSPHRSATVRISAHGTERDGDGEDGVVCSGAERSPPR